LPFFYFGYAVAQRCLLLITATDGFHSLRR
jgi:hypothetical protein